jgi:ferredoxin
MQVRVLYDCCLGHALCKAVAPEVFGVDHAGQSEVLVRGDIPESLETCVRAAAAGCPERAIIIEP